MWRSECARWARAYYFKRCIELGLAPSNLKSSSAATTSGSLATAIHFEDSTDVEMESGEVRPPTTISDEARDEIYEALREEEEGAAAADISPTLPLASSASKACSNDEANESEGDITDSDNETVDEEAIDVFGENCRYIKFQRKVWKLDALATFDLKDPYRVRCGRCGRWSVAKRANCIERFQEHRRGIKCANRSGNVEKPLTSYFGTRESTVSKRAPPSLPCPGLTHNSDARISLYLRRTAVPSGGAPPRHVLTAEMAEKNPTATREEVFLSVLHAERHRAKWINNHMTSSVSSPACTKVAFISSTGILLPCNACADILKIKAFRTALKRPMPSNAASKYVPKAYRNPLLGEAYQRHTDVRELMEMGDSKWLTFAKRGAAGRYKDFNALVGLMEAVTVVEDRGHRGVALTNMKYTEDFDRFCSILAAISPAAYKSFKAQFAGRSLSSMRALRAQKPRFLPGIVDRNCLAFLAWAESLGCRGMPISLSVDDTKLHEALRPYHDGGDDRWRLAGVHGCVPEFKTYDALVEALTAHQTNKAQKVRVWLGNLPIAQVPPFVIAIMPIKSTTTRQELKQWHDDLEAMLMRHNIDHISYTPDGASCERRLEHEILDAAKREGHLRKWPFSFLTVLGKKRIPVEVAVPLLSNGKPRVLGSDGKHGKEEWSGNPLLQADIVGVDKMDDRAGARLFSSAVLEFIAQHMPTELGLAAYLYVIGELIDAQQSRSMPHGERMKIFWRTRFFFERWLQSINDHPHYTARTHFISRELYDVFNLFIDAMLGLILIHRDCYPEVPLHLWLHSTECCEHFFGCARKIIKDFNMLDLILMMHKLTLLLDGDLRNRGSYQAKASAARSGYHHSWYDTEGIDYTVLVTF
ncbi:hypothetical protein PLICRDRAFT_699250, partial [Plicaturopsis crispa FD-325 SS-3]